MRTFLFTALGALLLPGCPVDDRTLQPIVVNIGVGGAAGTGEAGAAREAGAAGDSQAGAGGAGNGGESGAGAAGTTGGTGTGGKGGSGGSGGAGATGGTGAMGGGCGAPLSSDAGCGGGSPFRCPDLDDNDVPDCDETLAENASFDQDTSAWLADIGVESAWDDSDAHGDAESGALGLKVETVEDQDGTILLGARQCFSVTGGAAFFFGVEISVPDEADGVRAGIQLLVHESPACTGEMVDISPSPFVQGSAWSVAQLTYFTPTSAKSVAMRLIVQKPFRSSPATVLFDNAHVRKD